jgi:hypothetical protein
MERIVWTDERLDDRFTSIDCRLDTLVAEVRELRAEMHRDFLHLAIAMIGGFTAQVAALVAVSL